MVRRLMLSALAIGLLVCVAGAALAAEATAQTAVATFAGGCFWCMEPPFDALPGVISTTSGFMGGTTVKPTYEQVSAGGTGHAEVVQVVYDPARISYRKLLEVYWRNIDPLAKDRQFCDSGRQYRSAIFYGSPGERRLAEESRERLAKERGWRIVTEIVAAGPFYPADDSHQDYYRKNPLRYKWYRSGCGRDKRLEELWGKP